MSSITIKDLTKKFGDKVAISNVDISVDNGEFLVLLGPSGCGKSTLLRMIAGLDRVSAGAIHVDDQRVDHLPASARNMAFVFQSYALYPHMSVRENITFPLLMREFRWWHHIPLLGGALKRRIARRPDIAQAVESTAKMLSLGALLERLPKALSGGQRQRVALGRAMVRQPGVFLMDEPLSNLDAKLRGAMRAEITKLHRRVGSTFVYVTHDQIEAMTMASRIVLMRDGVIQQIGSPEEIYYSPANVFVARFIGTPGMNLLRARPGGDDLLISGQGYKLLGSGEAVAEDEVLLGIRPNKLRLAADGEPHDFEGTISLVEHLGAETVLAVDLANAALSWDDEDSRGNEMLVTLPGYGTRSIGDKVRIVADLQEALVFEHGSGLRVTAPGERT